MNQNTFHSRIKSGVISFLAGACLLFQVAIPMSVQAEQPEAQNRNVSLSDIGGCPMFPANNIWNTRVDNLPLDSRSNQWINSIGRNTGFHMDFGTVWDGGPIGIPYNVVGSSVPKVSVTFDYDDESDPGPYPIPDNPLIEYGGDRHILIVDQSTCKLYELFAARKPGSQWRAGSGAIWDLNSNALRPDTWTSADAAGLPILPGLVRYEEVQSGEIDHAIRFTASETAGYIWPARHLTSAPQAGIPPMGARFRLKASYDISGFPAPLQVILRAMKKYGIILADNGSNWYISGAPNQDWDDDMLHQLDDLTGADFEAVDTSRLMVDYDSGAATPRAVMYDDTESPWTYSSGWTALTASGPYNGTYHRTNVKDSTATFTFQAPAFFTLYYRTGTNRGSFEIRVDDVLLKTINAYSATTAWQKKYTSPAYTGSGSHTVVIRNIAPNGKYIDVDAMEITLAPAPSGPGIYDDSLNTLWVYSPGWTAIAPGSAYGGTTHRTSVKGSTATFVFQAPGHFIFTYRKCVSCGTFTIWVDGLKIATLDAYSATTRWQKTYISPEYVDDKVHTIVIKNTSPAGTSIDVDAVEVVSP